MGLLYDNIRKNSELVFIDGSNRIELSISEFIPFDFEFPVKDLIFAYLDNSIESILILLSAFHSKHCVALLPPGLSNIFKENLEKIYNPGFIYDPKRDFVLGYQSEVLSVTQFIFKRLVPKGNTIDENIKVLLTTSGTTGSSKFVKLSEANLFANAQSILGYLPINKQDIVPLNLPIYYSYGLSVFTTNALAGGKIVCLNNDVFSKGFWEKEKEFGFTSLAGVPFVYEMLDRIGFNKRTKLPYRYLTQAGGKLQVPLVKKFYDFSLRNSIDFFVMYGQTEATARMSYMPPAKLGEHLGSIGVPIPGGKFEINHETGELIYYGPNVFGGYVNGPLDLEAFLPLKALETGDKAICDEDGFYYITGRLKRIIKLFGTRINLDEIESLLYNEFNYTIKCSGVGDKWLTLFYENANTNIDEIKQYLIKTVGIYHTSIRFHMVEKFPQTPNGKIDYVKLESIDVTE